MCFVYFITTLLNFHSNVCLQLKVETQQFSTDFAYQLFICIELAKNTISRFKDMIKTIVT